MTIVFLHFSPLPHGTPRLPAASPAKILLQMINDCDPVTLPLPHKSPSCPVPVFQLTLLHQLLLHETRPIFHTETVLASLLFEQVKFISSCLSRIKTRKLWGLQPQ
ncbi:hypothetical protein AVEN_29457-1 [Araneus ventricosus]|uniref:Uncharacterized protein n=1 Tax=Araneus ventricosus TaxID=182803 RepID=A0A4Y2KEL4_ARAVE|nr:hypothetical protein AVEN_29457-1 [Araneus ventricosus]